MINKLRRRDLVYVWGLDRRANAVVRDRGVNIVVRERRVNVVVVDTCLTLPLETDILAA